MPACARTIAGAARPGSGRGEHVTAGQTDHAKSPLWLFGRMRAEEDAPDLRVGAQRCGITIAVVAAIDKDRRAIARSPAPRPRSARPWRWRSPSRLISRMVANNCSAAIGDRPAEGSSSNSSTGCTISAIAIASTWRCPPDSVRAARWRFSASIGKRAKAASMRAAVSRGIDVAAHLQVFPHRSWWGRRSASCGTKATPTAGDRARRQPVDRRRRADGSCRAPDAAGRRWFSAAWICRRRSGR